MIIIPSLLTEHNNWRYDMKFIGIDLHTNCFTACFLDEKGNKTIITYNLNAEGTRKFLENVNMEFYVIVEATINTFCFVNLIKSNVGQVLVANTYELKTVSFTNKKTNKVDAYKLARIMKSQILVEKSRFIQWLLLLIRFRLLELCLPLII